jgi:hypothetical protein
MYEGIAVSDHRHALRGDADGRFGVLLTQRRDVPVHREAQGEKRAGAAQPKSRVTRKP